MMLILTTLLRLDTERDISEWVVVLQESTWQACA